MGLVVAEGEPPRLRRYDKGERRFKHVGKGSHPVIELDRGDPKKWVGKCPRGVPLAELEALLNAAVEAPNGDRELDAPKKLYAVFRGAIYEAQTSDGGNTYHGYPYKGKLSSAILDELKKMAEEEKSVDEFSSWVKKHIVRHGARK
jgi:hypothetical protein